ncbi:MAG: hypothetical protein IJB29_07305 [Mailhella sp.]|nr:hypothetical protein [Mailhella sp.]
MSSFVTGQIIEARCSRCRDVTGHVVMACLDGMPIKVECRACGSVHKYTAPGAAPRRKAETTVRVKAGHGRAEAVDATVKAEKAIERRAEQMAEPKAPRISKAEQAAQRKAEENEQRWGQAMALIVAEPVAYNMNASFPVRSLVEHPVFGTGVVTELLPPDKMDVLFREGVKRLRCVC